MLQMSTFYVAFMAMSAQAPMMQFVTFLLQSHEMLTCMCNETQPHVLLSTIFHSFCRWIDILFTKYGICIVIDVVIVDPTWANLLCWFCATQGFVASKVAKAKKRNYHNQHPTNHFLPLVIEVFRCLNKQDVCFYMVVPMPCGTSKGQNAFFFLFWLFFFAKKFQLHHKGYKYPPS
jgi:hypothetical protein